VEPDHPAADAAHADLDWLAAHGMLDGVAGILRERREQAEKLCYDARHDDRHENGWLIAEAAHRLVALMAGMLDGEAGWPEVLDQLAKAGALCAAETDRVDRMLITERMPKGTFHGEGLDRDPVILATPSGDLVRDLGGKPDA
jgi:hypothetical protein